MTLHVVTITPNQIVSVSDRLLSTTLTSKNNTVSYLKLDDDRYKHFVLQTDDGRCIISFTGFAGIIVNRNKIYEATIDWLTNIVMESQQLGYHIMDEHLNAIRTKVNQHTDKLKKQYPQSDFRLAILVSGWVNTQAFSCLIDNCIESKWTWSEKARDSFTTSIRNYSNAKFEDGSYITFLGDMRLAMQQRSLRKQLTLKAKEENTKEMIDTSVQLIRATSLKSNGTIGNKCTGIYMSRNEPGFGVVDHRDDPKFWTVFPNFIISTSRIKIVHQNDEVNRPKPPATLRYLVTPPQADSLYKEFEFWSRAIELVRLLHNEQGKKVRKDSESHLQSFHRWQRDSFDPVNEAALNKLNTIKEQLPKEKVNGKLNILDKQKARNASQWDEFIDLRDVVLFK